MRWLWLGLLLCACSGSSDNEVDGSVMGFSLDARDAVFLVHNGRQVVVISSQDNTCRKLATGTMGGEIRLLEMYLWNAASNPQTALVEGTYEVADNGSTALESQAYLGVGPGCSNFGRWFAASAGRVILLHAGATEPGERSQVAFRLAYGDEVLAGHADAAYCEVPQTGEVLCVNDGVP